jgi:hypothetical protein
MQINRIQLLAVCSLNEVTSCSEATELARVYLVSCAEALERFGEEEPFSRLSDITTTYIALAEHCEICSECKELHGELERPRIWWAEQEEPPAE